MIRMIFGSLLAIACIVLYYFSNQAIGKKNEKCEKQLLLIFTMMGTLISIGGLVVPGAASYFIKDSNVAIYDAGTVNVQGDVYIDSPIDIDSIEKPDTITEEDIASEPEADSVDIESDDMSVEIRVRQVGDGEWLKSVDATVGDEVEFMIHYKNLTDKVVDNVIIEASLPENMEYIKGTTEMYNTNHPNGAVVNSDSIITDHGINIGKYAPQGDCYVKFRAVVKDVSLVEGTNRLITWTKITSGRAVNQNNADTYVVK